MARGVKIGTRVRIKSLGEPEDNMYGTVEKINTDHSETVYEIKIDDRHYTLPYWRYDFTFARESKK